MRATSVLKLHGVMPRCPEEFRGVVKIFNLKHMPAANSVIVESRPKPQPE